MTEDRNCNCNNENMKDCQMCNNQKENMLQEIRSLDFAVEELALYLDTHPEDRRALCLHREYARRLKDIKDKYQRVYGPLSIYYPCNSWRWLEEPWPWEYEGGNC